MRPQGSARSLEVRRRKAVALLRKGRPAAEVAREVGASESSVHRWKKMAHSGPRGLAAKAHPGRTPRLTDTEVRELKRLLRRGPRKNGWHGDYWTAEKVAELIQRTFGVKYHPEHVRRLVKSRLGFQEFGRRSSNNGNGRAAKSRKLSTEDTRAVSAYR